MPLIPRPKPALADLDREIKKVADPRRAAICRTFFKTGPGQYGEGDLFIGVSVPDVRKLCKKYDGISVQDAISLLKSPVHEKRLASLILLIRQFDRGDEKTRERLHKLYLKHLNRVNNWDLVDVSAHILVGRYLEDKNRALLYSLAKGGLWQRRVAVVATWHFIRKGDFKDILKLSRIMLKDTEDLIHKASGWMLREVGKRDRLVLENFLKKNCVAMPRTMLRYAIEKLPQNKKTEYMTAAKKKPTARHIGI